MDSIYNAVMDLANKYLKPYKVKNGQVVPELCPFCGKEQTHDKETFAIGTYNGLWNCLRGSCHGINGSREGNFKQLCDYFGETSFEFSSLPKSIRAAKKVYVKPDPTKFKDITEAGINYLASRGISPDTIKDFGLLSDEEGNIVFPFYRDKKLVYIKKRKPKKYYKGDGPKEWQEANTEPILFGMDNVSFRKPLVICEGEIDALSLYEAGVHNVVSVPAGCNNTEWVDLCWDWLESFNEIILFGDSDEPGMEMVSILMKRLGEDRCMVPKEYPELIFNGKDYNKICKDANEILMCYGADNLKALVDACEPAPIKGLLDVSTIPYVNPASIPRIITKIPALDKMIGGFAEAGLTIISGQKGEGKSTISSSFMLQAIEQGYNVCAYSGELSKNQFLDWVLLSATESKYISYNTDPRTGKRICCVTPEVEERIRKWLEGKLFLFDNGAIFEEDEASAILRVFDMAARRYGCRLFLVDNLMTALCSPDEENKAQARFTAKLKAFANKYKAHVLMVAHPRKTKPGTTFQNDDISGSSAIGNLATTVLNIEKPNIRVAKNREFGETGLILCDFDPVNRRIYQKNLGDRIVYSWDHTGIKEPEDQAITLPEFQIQPGEGEKVPF